MQHLPTLELLHFPKWHYSEGIKIPQDDNSTLWANEMCITELRLTCCPNEFTLREN